MKEPAAVLTCSMTRTWSPGVRYALTHICHSKKLSCDSCRMELEKDDMETTGVTVGLEGVVTGTVGAVEEAGRLITCTI